MYCRNCGKERGEDTKFCQFCGANQELEIGLNDDATQQSTDQAVNEVKERLKSEQSSGQLYLIVGWISVAISLWFIPILFGTIAVIMGYLYREKNEKMGTIIMISGVAGAALGFLLGMILS